ncbi:MAG: sugar phosphate isomerase/epimerase [Gemmataceae bacterium]|nr:sugar phosphate isomerase/epimerase [Gemmataceae bacterium]
MKIGVRLESLAPANFRAGLEAARRIGAAGVQFDAVGDLHPDRLGESARREVGYLLRSHGLVATALHCPLRNGLDSASNLEARIAHLQKAMTLSFDLGARIVIVDGGRVPESADDPRRVTLRESLLALAAYGDRTGTMLALEAGGEPAARLVEFLDMIPGTGLGINYDPANFIVRDMDPLTQLTAFGGRVVHVHAHDAKAGTASRAASTVPLGGGDVDWLAIIGTLTAQEYHGFLVVEHDDSDPAAVATGVGFLRRLV